MKKVILLLISAIMILAGCASESEATEILFWTPFSGPDGANMQQIVDDYNESQDVYEVKMEIIPNADYYTTLDTTLTSEDSAKPDVMIMHGDQIYTYAQKGLIMPLSETELSDFDMSIFAESAMEGVTVDEVTYGVPLDVHPMVMYYNKDVLAAAGYTKPPTTGDEFLEMAIATTDPETGVYGAPIPPLWPQNFLLPTLVYQMGGTLFTEDGQPNFTDPAIAEALALEYSWIYEYGISPTNLVADEDWTMFISGKAAFTFNGPWMMNQATEAGINYGVAPVPQFGETNAVWAGSHNFVIPTGTSAEKQAGVEDFVNYVQANGESWAESGQAPASSITQSSEEFQAMTNSVVVADAAQVAVQAPDVENFGPKLGPLMDATARVLTGEQEIDAALEQAQQEAMSMQ